MPWAGLLCPFGAEDQVGVAESRTLIWDTYVVAFNMYARDSQHTHCSLVRTMVSA
jgi:hypothetical protein